MVTSHVGALVVYVAADFVASIGSAAVSVWDKIVDHFLSALQLDFVGIEKLGVRVALLADPLDAHQDLAGFLVNIEASDRAFDWIGQHLNDCIAFGEFGHGAFLIRTGCKTR